MDLRKLGPGDRILDYRLIERLGEGGFGEVFRAEHEVLGRVVAIKTPRDPGGLAALRHEGLVQARLDHPHIVKTLDVSLAHDPPFIVMDYVDGESLAEMLQRRQTLPWREAAPLLLDAARALAFAHEHGVVHGDVKPGNLLIQRAQHGTQDTNPKALLTDFGLGRVFEGPSASLQISRSLELARSGAEVHGTIRYIAPEVLRGEPADARADLYSFGILLFEAITGRLPEGHEVPSDLVSEIPKELDRVFARMFTRAERRPSSLESTIRDLEHLIDTGPVVASLDAPRRTSGSTKRNVEKLQQLRGTNLRELERRGFRRTGIVKQAGAPRPSSHDHRKQNEPKQSAGARQPLDRSRPAPVRALPADQPYANHTPGATPMHETPVADRPRTPFRETPAFVRWRQRVLEQLQARMSGVRNVHATEGHGFDVCFGVETEGEPHHRVYNLILPAIDADTARATVATARRIFEQEKGIWEKEVTFYVMAREVKNLDQVLWAFKNFSMGWWRRRRVMLHDVSKDKLYASELGCDPRGNPLKRSFTAAVQQTLTQLPPSLADGPRAPSPVRYAPRPRGTAWGASLALLMAFGLLGGLVAIDYAKRHAKDWRCSKPAPMEDAAACCPDLGQDPGHPLEAALIAIQPHSPAESPGAVQPGAPTESPGAVQPGAPAESPGAVQPGAPAESPGAVQPGAPAESPGAVQPGAPAESPGAVQPGGPSESPGAVQPGAPAESPGFLRDPFRAPIPQSLPERTPDAFTPDEPRAPRVF